MSPPPFQTFLDGHRDAVYRFLVFSVGPDDADDCLQETFTAALRSYPRLEDGSNLRAWVRTIAHRKAIDAHRARGRRPAPTDAVPEGPAESKDGEPALWKLVDGLPDKQRVAVRARFVEDLAYVDIGRRLGCSKDAARRSVHEGIKKLRGAWT